MGFDIEEVFVTVLFIAAFISIFGLIEKINTQFLFPVHVFCLLSVVLFYISRFTINTHKNTVNKETYLLILAIPFSLCVGNIIYMLKENSGHLLLLIAFSVVALVMFLDFLQELDIITLFGVRNTE